MVVSYEPVSWVVSGGSSRTVRGWELIAGRNVWRLQVVSMREAEVTERGMELGTG
jgi:hypothetical protein